MGMDLKPINPTPDAPKDEDGRLEWGRYNWTGWRWIVDHLQAWGVSTSEFKGCNDGDPISAETCRKVADAIEAHLPELEERDRKWLAPHVERWRTCGGYQQF